MYEKAGIKGGERVLVKGGSVGVGTMVVQVAKPMGAKRWWRRALRRMPAS